MPELRSGWVRRRIRIRILRVLRIVDVSTAGVRTHELILSQAAGQATDVRRAYNAVTLPCHHQHTTQVRRQAVISVVRQQERNRMVQAHCLPNSEGFERDCRESGVESHTLPSVCKLAGSLHNLRRIQRARLTSQHHALHVA